MAIRSIENEIATDRLIVSLEIAPKSGGWKFLGSETI